MDVWIVFEYTAYGSKIVGVYAEEKKAKERHAESPVWRYIEEYEVE